MSGSATSEGDNGDGEIKESIPTASRTIDDEGSEDEDSAGTSTASDTNSTANIYHVENKPRLLLMGLKR
ncbi:MAG: hypothetical protein Q9191_001416 [Dirinaria sp. TL-2023a]